MENTRAAARAAGDKTYLGGPCIHGHRGERYTKNALCVDCQRKRALVQHDEGVHRHNEARRENAFMAEFYPEEFDRQGWRRGKVMEWQDEEGMSW